MKFTLKQQLIWLAKHRVPYRGRWYYLQYCHQHQLEDSLLALSDCYAILYELVNNGILLFEDLPKAMEEDEEVVLKLSREAFMIGEYRYPSLWLEIPKPPLVMYYKGDISLLDKPLVSIIGTRKVSQYGQQVTTQLVRAIVKKGWCTVSGMAKGIDHVVHTTAAHYSPKSTIAIIPTGLSQCYPKEHEVLQHHLMAHHLVLSEYLPHQGPRKHHFVMRNRLVAGLTQATLIMEAAQQSGSLITANYALQFNREVFALPGRITDEVSRGCNALIEVGATPICDVNTTIEALSQLFSRNQHFFS